MENLLADIRRTREDHYFMQQEQKRLEEMRRKSAQEAEILRLMEAFGIWEQELIRELVDAGFDIETFRLLYLAPLVQVAWSDGAVSQRERDQVLEIAGMHGIKAGSAAHERLVAWLTERPSDQFFQACLRGVKAMLRHRSTSETQELSRDLVSYCVRIASASGGFLGLGSRMSREEEVMLSRLVTELDVRHHSAIGELTRELQR